MKRYIKGSNVFDMALNRLIHLYEDGHRVVVSLSGGKDSGICLELARMAAEATGRLPVEVLTRDEEIVVPGTNEYLDYVYNQKKYFKFDLVIANQPIVNVFNRKNPYWWVYDPFLDPKQWVTQPPPYAKYIKENTIDALVTKEKYPPDEGKDLFAVIGLRADESRTRGMAIHSAKGTYLTQETPTGYRKCFPIYDWANSDVWKAYHDYGWRYNTVYDVMFRSGVPTLHLRVGPPTMTIAGLPSLKVIANAYPTWFDKVCKRCPGIRTAVQYGKRVCEPYRRVGETWEDCFKRECIRDAPDWICDRASRVMTYVIGTHEKHSTTPFPEIKGCFRCRGFGTNSWRKMANALYMGDPFCLRVKKMPVLTYMEPNFFREGAGVWGGRPTW